MKKTILAILLLIGSFTLSAKECIEFKAPKEENFKTISFEKPVKKEQHVHVFLKAGKTTYDGYYYCYKEKKTDKVLTCLGDDDGGRFDLTLEEKSASMLIQYLNIGDPDRKNFQLLRKKKIEMKGTYQKCK